VTRVPLVQWRMVPFAPAQGPRLAQTPISVETTEAAAARPWSPETIYKRGLLFSFALPLGFVIGATLNLLIPSFRQHTFGRQSLNLAGIAAGVGSAAVLFPMEGSFFDFLARFAGGFSGIFLSDVAVVPKKKKKAA
jgi:hypothetical protein